MMAVMQPSLLTEKAEELNKILRLVHQLKTKNMKKYIERVAILLALVMFGFVSAYAQEAGDIAVGINIVYTPNWLNDYRETRYIGEPGKTVRQVTKPYNANGGFGAKIQYNVTNPIRVEGAFAVLPSGFGLGMWYLSVNANYLIPVMKKLNVYPIAGFDFMKYTSDEKGCQTFDYSQNVVVITQEAGNYTIFGVNIGGGIEYKLSRKFSLQGEVRYIIGFDSGIYSENYKTNRLMISIGAAYKLNANR